ncbi:hypothetical protein OUZ56_015373 [Daphnia magna]|uniref:Uncharacterized protein n=1 Tax=Daphnia magna TaxID=35525 RepID=A0ABR0AMM9_9CRUS|nr:hypothetical protein OUZ56_015373 [Daphnia magna]
MNIHKRKVSNIIFITTLLIDDPRESFRVFHRHKSHNKQSATLPLLNAAVYFKNPDFPCRQPVTPSAVNELLILLNQNNMEEEESKMDTQCIVA